MTTYIFVLIVNGHMNNTEIFLFWGGDLWLIIIQKHWFQGESGFTPLGSLIHSTVFTLVYILIDIARIFFQDVIIFLDFIQKNFFFFNAKKTNIYEKVDNAENKNVNFMNEGERGSWITKLMIFTKQIDKIPVFYEVNWREIAIFAHLIC